MAAAVATLVIQGCSSTKTDDSCGTARDMINYNKTQTEAIAAKSDPATGTEAGVADYQQWADQLKNYAGKTSGAQATHAQKVADLAGQTVTLVQQARSNNSDPLVAQPPEWVQKYSDTQIQFQRELSALKDSCPT